MSLDKQEVQEFVSTLHCALENGADVYVKECQKIRHYRTRSTEERRKIVLYSDVIHSFDWKSAIEHDGDV